MPKEPLNVRSNFKQRLRAVAEKLKISLTEVHETCMKYALGEALIAYDMWILREIKKPRKGPSQK